MRAPGAGRRLLWGALCLGLAVSLAACGRQTSPLPDLSSFGEVTVISREEGSGTRAEFESLLGTTSGGTDQIALSTDEVLELVAGGEGTLGYLAYSALAGSEDSKILSVDGVLPESQTLQDGSYPLCRNYYVAYMGQLNDTETDFLAYLLSAGQELVSQHCIPVKKASSFLSNGSSGTITICGSSSVAPLMEELAADYQSYNPNAEILITASDSASGLTAAIRGECDLAMSSRSLKDYEAELLEAKVIASDGIAVVVNKANPLEGLTLSQIKDLYNGTVSLWSDLKS